VVSNQSDDDDDAFFFFALAISLTRVEWVLLGPITRLHIT
jgi:hypothetical protein